MEIFNALITQILALIAFFLNAATPTPTPTVTLPTPVPPPSLIRQVPAGFHVYHSPDGCTEDRRCPYPGKEDLAGFYDAPTRAAVIVLGDALDVLHETCHAHQHLVILQETGMEPGLALNEWYGTTEGQMWTAATEGHPSLWTWGRQNGMEDFAESCGRFYMGILKGQDPLRYRAIVAIIENR